MIMSNVETLNAIQAAEVLFADAETVLELARKGVLPGTKIGKCWVFLREDVLSYLRSRVEQDTMARRNELAAGPKPVGLQYEAPGDRRRRAPPALPMLHDMPPPRSSRRLRP
jgi:excisionase family DNA binding protein